MSITLHHCIPHQLGSSRLTAAAAVDVAADADATDADIAAVLLMLLLLLLVLLMSMILLSCCQYNCHVCQYCTIIAAMVLILVM